MLNFSRMGHTLIIGYAAGVAINIYDTSSKYSVIEVQRDNKPTLSFRVEKEVWTDEQLLDKIMKRIESVVNDGDGNGNNSN